MKRLIETFSTPIEDAGDVIVVGAGSTGVAAALAAARLGLRVTLVDSASHVAVTLRGNTGEQYGPPVTTDHPPCRGNHIHHLRVSHCGQDGGDMGALHAASLNNSGGGSVNTFEQITVADTRAIASMKDWPKMSMDQIFRHVQIVRAQGMQLRSHKPENGDSAQTENVSWKPGFREDLMDVPHIGLTAEFPAAYRTNPNSSKKQTKP